MSDPQLCRPSSSCPLDANLDETIDAVLCAMADFRECLEASQPAVDSIEYQADRHLLRLTPSIVINVRSGAIVQASATAEQLLGFSRGELRGRPVGEVVPSHCFVSRPEGRCAYIRSVRAAESCRSSHWLIVRRATGEAMTILVWSTLRAIRGDLYLFSTGLPAPQEPPPAAATSVSENRATAAAAASN
jgi:PAS domain S-box-containing protein